MNAYGAQEYFENKDYLVKYFEKLNKIKADNYEVFNDSRLFFRISDPSSNTSLTITL